MGFQEEKVEVKKIGKEGLFTLPPTSGITASEWVRYFSHNDFWLNSEGLLVDDFHYFRPTTGNVYEVVVLSCQNDGKYLQDVYKSFVEKRGFYEVNVEVACMFRRYVTNSFLRQYLPHVEFVNFVFEGRRGNGIFHSYQSEYTTLRSFEYDRFDKNRVIDGHFDYLAFLI